MRLAVLGLGSAGSRHARILRELGHEVVGWDPAAEPPTGVEAAAEMDAAIASADAVVVASPNALHAEQALAAIEAGTPVLVEKPLAVTAAHAERVVAAAEAAGTLCAVAMNLRYHPAVEAIGRLAADGELGALRFARASFGFDLRLWRPQTDYRQSYSARSDLGGGIVLDAIHEIDYVMATMGPVEFVGAETAHLSELEIDVEDIGLAVLRHRSGALSQLDLNFFEPAYRRGCVLVGSEAVAEWRWQDGLTLRRHGGDRVLIDGPSDLALTYRAELEQFVAAVRGDEPPAVPASEGLAALRVAEAIKRSAREGARVALA